MPAINIKLFIEYLTSLSTVFGYSIAVLDKVILQNTQIKIMNTH